MSTKLNTIKKKLMLSAALMLVGMAVAPIASAAQRYCTTGNSCVTCYQIVWKWVCF